MMMTRRSMFRAIAACVAAGAGVTAYTFGIEPTWLEVVRRPLQLKGLPKSLDGRTLAHLSDIHAGPMVSDDYLIDTFRRVAVLKPDIVVFTGDLMSWHVDWRDHVASIYHHAPRGTLATIASLGNHDYGIAWADSAVATKLVDILRSLRITVLRNEVLDVEGLQIAGLDDLWSKRINVGEVVDAIDRQRPAIALSHNPDSVDLPAWSDFEGWILAGHTHGGQCRPPFLPPPILPVRNRRYTSGEFQLTGDRRLYISRGVGHLMPVRFNSRPEVTIFELQSSD